MKQRCRKDFWSDLAVIGAREVRVQFLLWIIKSPKKWSSKNRTSQTSSYTCVKSCSSCLFSFTAGSGVDHCDSDSESLEIKDMLEKHTVIIILLHNMKIRSTGLLALHDHVSFLQYRPVAIYRESIQYYCIMALCCWSDKLHNLIPNPHFSHHPFFRLAMRPRVAPRRREDRDY